MTFSDLVLKARRRLHDLRDGSGSVITDATKDGIRWTSNELADVCKTGLIELQRNLIALGLKRHINTAAQYQFVTCEIKVGSGFGEVIGLPDGFYDVKRLQTTDASKIYEWMEQDEFFGARYLMVEDSNGNFIDKRVFTMVYSEEANRMKVLTLPIPTPEVNNVQAIILKSLESLYDLESTDDLPFVNSFDLLLDYVEREARRIEHNPNQLKAVNDYINFKLRMLSNEIQRSDS